MAVSIDVISTLVVKMLKSYVHIQRLKLPKLVKHCKVRCKRINKNEEQLASIKTVQLMCIPDGSEQNLIVDKNVKRKIVKKIKKPKKAPPRNKPNRHIEEEEFMSSIKEEIIIEDMPIVKEEYIEEYNWLHEEEEELQILITSTESLSEGFSGWVLSNVQGNYQGEYEVNQEWEVSQYKYLNNLEQLQKYITSTGRPSREHKLPTKYNNFIMDL